MMDLRSALLLVLALKMQLELSYHYPVERRLKEVALLQELEVSSGSQDVPKEHPRDDESRLLRRLYHINISNSLLKDKITIKLI
jgi:hypothetical protein